MTLGIIFLILSYFRYKIKHNKFIQIGMRFSQKVHCKSGPNFQVKVKSA